MNSPQTTAISNQVRLRKILFPVEHGGWGFLFEPIILGLIVAPGVPAVCIAVMTIAMFLVRHPLKLFLHDRKTKGKSARLKAAGRVAMSYAAVALLALGATIRTGGWLALVPFAIVSPLVFLYLIFDFSKRGRLLLAELVGPFALGVSASSIVLARGWAPTDAVTIWVVLMARSVPSIFYVRTRLRLDRGRPARTVVALSWASGSVALLAAMSWLDVIPILPSVAAAGLLVRAAYGLSPYRRRVSVRTIGFSEIAFGLLYVVVVALGYRLPL